MLYNYEYFLEKKVNKIDLEDTIICILFSFLYNYIDYGTN